MFQHARNMFFAASITLICFNSISQTSSDLSGTYTTKPSGSKSTAATITITEDGNQIRIVQKTNDSIEDNTFSLDGSTGVYRTAKGVEGKGSAHWKGEVLVIETFVVSSPKNGMKIRFHTTEQWKLSKKKDSLKIRIDVDSPDMPRDVTNAAFPGSTSEYSRTSETH